MPENIEKTKEEKDKQLEAITRLIRYGFQEALDKISEFVSDNCEKYNYDELCGLIQDYIMKLKKEKHEINLIKLGLEIPE